MISPSQAPACLAVAFVAFFWSSKWHGGALLIALAVVMVVRGLRVRAAARLIAADLLDQD